MVPREVGLPQQTMYRNVCRRLYHEGDGRQIALRGAYPRLLRFFVADIMRAGWQLGP